MCHKTRFPTEHDAQVALVALAPFICADCGPGLCVKCEGEWSTDTIIDARAIASAQRMYVEHEGNIVRGEN